mgnify:FL=1
MHFLHSFCKKYILSAVLLLGILLSVCTAMVQAEGLAKVKELETVNLQLKWVHQFQFAGYYAAKEQGYYADVGLDVHIHASKLDKSVVNQVISEEAEYGVGDVGILFNYALGAPIKVLAAIFQHNPLVFISKKSSGITRPQDIIGKRVMQRAIATDESSLRLMLTEAKISQEQYTSVKHSFDYKDLMAGKVDVMTGYITNQPFALKQLGIEVNVIDPQNYGVDFYEDLLFTSEYELEHHPGRASRFLAASIKGWNYAFSHTEELVQLIKTKYHPQSSIEQLRNEAIETRKLVLPDTIPVGQIKIERLKQLADIYSRLNLSRQLSDKELTAFIYQGSEVPLNKKEREWLQENPIIRLGIDRNFAPYEWIDDSGHYDGITADYIKLFELRLGVKFKAIKDKESWHDVLEGAKSGEMDMLSCLVKTAEREVYLNFSEPYLTSSAVIITEQSNGYIGQLKHLEGKQLAIQKGHYTQELLTKDYPKIKIISTENIKEALQMVSEGEAYAYVGDVTSASYVMKKEGFLNLVFSGPTPYKSQYRFAAHKSNAILTSIMNKTLATITQHEKDSIYNHWRALKITQGVSGEIISRYVLGIVCLFLLFTYWIFRLRKSARAVKASEAKLQLILDTEPECVKVVDADGRLVQMNPAGLKMIDVEDAEQLIGQKVEQLVVAEHRAAYNEMNQRVLKGESCTLEFQIQGLAGSLIWVDTHAVPLIDEDDVVSVISITRDITQRKKNEEQQKIAAMVYQNSSEGMLVTDSENIIIAINPAFSRITGYSFDEVIGEKPRFLKSGLQDDSFYQAMWKSINDTGHWEGEIWNKHKQGYEYAEWLIINTIYTKDGSVAQHVALFSDITEKKKAEQVIWHQANYDALTRLPNRSMFMDRLKQDIKFAARTQKPLAVIFLDLDHFKEVNDTLGHDLGDELLCIAAKRLKACVRDSDTVARLGGDEFIVVLPELDDVNSVERIAQNILQELSTVFLLAKEQAYVSASLGIALYPDDGLNPDDIIKHADQAMYLSKDLGRSRFSYFTKDMQAQAQYRLHLMNDMRSALQEKQFELYYQPIVDLETGQINKAEALIRWNHPTRGIVSPADFIPLAENSGLIIEIGDWVFKHVAKQVKIWRDKYNQNLQISVNKSPIQFRSATDRNDWLSYLKEIGLSGEGIVIEITEGLLMDNAANITHQLLQYRDAGIQVSMDDFGTGYSALSYLKKFDIDYLKIDQSFTRNLAPGSNDMALSEAIILMAHKLGLKVIAEGVETEQQRLLLAAAGCDYGQGYLFSRPIPADEFEALLIAKQ